MSAAHIKRFPRPTVAAALVQTDGRWSVTVGDEGREEFLPRHHDTPGGALDDLTGWAEGRGFVLPPVIEMFVVKAARRAPASSDGET